ncbi:unnamed protein product [Tenebrio molitor]|nr:unnamed protein product [Tenebrio molitor]
MWKNLFIIILCTFSSGCVHGLKCYVDEIHPSGCGYLKNSILQECDNKIEIYSSTSGFYYQVSFKQSQLRCYNISVEIGYLEGVVGGCTLNGGCKEITARLQYVYNTGDDNRITCLECDWDGCNSSHG